MKVSFKLLLLMLSNVNGNGNGNGLDNFYSAVCSVLPSSGSIVPTDGQVFHFDSVTYW